jgi:broad specificity phosphatase PhoE
MPPILIVVRHGQGEHNVRRVYNGDPQSQPPSQLTPVGVDQARSAGRYVSSMGYSTIDVCYVSELFRTKETLIHMNEVECKRIVIDPLINENTCGDAEGKTYAEMHKKHNVEDCWDLAAAHKAWGAESPESVRDRVAQFLKKVLALKVRAVMVVTHGCIMNEIIKQRRNQEIQPENGEVVILHLK